MKGLVSKGTVVLCWWGSEIQRFGFTNSVDSWLSWRQIKSKKQSLLWSDTGAERKHYMNYLPLSLPPKPPPLPSPTQHPQPKQFRNRLRVFSGWSPAITIFWSENGVSRSAHQCIKRLKTRLTCSLINLTRIRPLNVRAGSKLNCS